jgi:hypothetical protein
MDHLTLHSILSCQFRANPDYELVLFDRLPEEQKELLKGLENERDFYGVLRPREAAGLGVKSVDRDTALLFLSLQQPGPLPAYVVRMNGSQANRAMAELVLSDVLQVAVDGTFASSAGAWNLICAEEPLSAEGGTIARLSLAALKYAQALQLNDVQRLSARLYFYNRAPLSPRWRRQLPTPEAVRCYLGIEDGGACRRALEDNWSAIEAPPPADNWLQFQSRHRRPARTRGGYSHKLYVTPVCEQLPEVFPAVLEVLSRSAADQFKIGRDAGGLLRPDKIVAYFGSLEGVEQAASRLAEGLAGCPAQGVPFTAQMTEDGLISRGIDPPPDNALPGWMERESWRLWVTNRLATAILAATPERGGGMEPWQFALRRMRLEGVDTATWTPSDRIWDGVAEGEG